MSKEKTYLGDSVYADFYRGLLLLTTENGMGPPSNSICLEDKVVEALLKKLAENYDIDRMCRILQQVKHQL